MKSPGEIDKKPRPFEFYTSPLLWNDPHISKGMLNAHLDETNDAASYRVRFIEEAVAWISDRFGICKDTALIDFGCGPGHWTTRFAERGAMVTGIDLSERSIQYALELAKSKQLRVNYINQDYLQFSTKDHFDLITMISTDFSVLSPQQRSSLLRTFRNLLKEDGCLLLDVASLEFFNEQKEKRDEQILSGGYWAEGQHSVSSCTFKYEKINLLCEKYRIVEEAREFEIYVWNQCYSKESLTSLFESCGLKIVEFYADVSGKPFHDNSTKITAIATRI